MHLRVLHRSSALVLAAFAAVHVTNHLMALAGVAAHIAFMEAARGVYRFPPVEWILLACAGFQVGSGLWLFFRGWRERKGRVAWLQAVSGAYLAFFLPVHVGAVLFGRQALQLDTNFYFAAAGFHVPPFQWFFGPYYLLAVLALFVHLGCAVYWNVPGWSRKSRALALALPAAAGFGISLLIVLALGGVLRPLEIPVEYKATYGRPRT